MSAAWTRFWDWWTWTTVHRPDVIGLIALGALGVLVAGILVFRRGRHRR